jgi:phosphate transport system ATP-binding protein
MINKTIKQYALESQMLNTWYGEKKILNDISMKVGANTITAIIGPSGCGKSTFIRHFNRMNDYIPYFRKTGAVLVEGVNIYKNSIQIEELRKSVGMVFQKANPFPKSIYENVAFGLKIQGKTNKSVLDETVEKSLQQASLWNEVKDDLKKNAMSLSVGQQQRLCIARALAVEPSVLLMDEPASALDPISTNHIESLILELKEKYTILIVTHNLHQASRVSDYTAFFCMGNLVEYNNTKELFTNPKRELTENYISGRFGSF